MKLTRLDGTVARAYVLARPPGHHAYADRAAGFCYLNNAAIAAEVLRNTFDKVAIVDFDTHHGDGTQAIFYARDDVLYGSVHTDPSAYYPHYFGYADETGTGPGTGANLNLPLAPGSGDDAFVAAPRRGDGRDAASKRARSCDESANTPANCCTVSRRGALSPPSSP